MATTTTLELTHPLELKKKWSLTYMQLAIALHYESDYTVRSWGLPGKRRRNPPPSVCLLASILDRQWSEKGEPIFFDLRP